MTAAQPLLEVRHLRVEFPSRRGTLLALDDISFDIAPGEILGVVGESGAGKSLTGAAIIGLLEPPGRIAGGEILLGGQRIDNLPYEKMRAIRGRRIGAIFQDPLTSLNPLYTIGRQLTETILTHLPVSDLPAPDSPTTPRISPGAMSKLMSSSASTVPRRDGNSTRRCRTSSSGAFIAQAQARRSGHPDAQARAHQADAAEPHLPGRWRRAAPCSAPCARRPLASAQALARCSRDPGGAKQRSGTVAAVCSSPARASRHACRLAGRTRCR